MVRDGELTPEQREHLVALLHSAGHGRHAGTASPADLPGQRRCGVGLRSGGVGTGRRRLR
ncbi:MAG: hypothetical protein ACRDTJ_32615 [Pseudonocardiaceae bacterium]